MSEGKDIPRLTACHAGCGRMVEYKFCPRVVCAECRPARQREQARLVAERKRRRVGVPTVKGTTTTCRRCDRPFVRLGINARYCAPCKQPVILERARLASERKRATPEGRAAYNAWYRESRVADPSRRVSDHMRTMIHRGLGKGKAGRSWREFVPYTLEELMAHLERQFLSGMTWDNRRQWHIDHIVPLASFTFTSPDDPEFRAAWALTNVRPLWAKDNIRKSAKRTHLL